MRPLPKPDRVGARRDMVPSGQLAVPRSAEELIELVREPPRRWPSDANEGVEDIYKGLLRCRLPFEDIAVIA